MGPNKETEGSEPAPITPGGTYSIQVCHASRRPSTSLFPCGADQSTRRPSPSDVRYTFAGLTLTEPPRNVSRKSFPSASARPALIRRVGDPEPQNPLRSTSNRKTSGNISFIGNTSTNVSTNGWSDPGSYSVGTWSGRNPKLLNQRKYPPPRSLRASSRGRRRIRLALDLPASVPQLAPSPL